MNRRIYALVLCLVMVVTMFAACGGQKAAPAPASEAPAAPASEAPAASASEAPAPAKETFKVYLITMDLMDQHWAAVDEGAKKAAGELGIEYKWTAPTNGKDDAAQIECINNAVADGANLILLASNGPTTQVATLEEVSKDGVKIIYVDSPAEFPAIQTLATNNTNAGTTAGQEMLAALKEQNVTSGKIGIVNVNSATTSTVQREDGFRKAFEGSGFEILATQYGEGQVDKSQQIATNYVTEGCVGIFGTNEGGTVGVGNAIKEAGKKIVGVGFDKSDAVLQLIKDGALLCTMAQNPYDMGYKGMKTAHAALTGGDTGPESIDTGVSVIKK
ncbi:ABC transporter substrate-binding protein [Oscillospiraceae bacterium PP1C4]